LSCPSSCHSPPPSTWPSGGAATPAQSRTHERSEHVTPWLGVATLVALLIALLIPVLGWGSAWSLLWLSHTWTTREKAIGTLLALGVGALALLTPSAPSSGYGRCWSWS
jgi:hypothetical protein